MYILWQPLYLGIAYISENKMRYRLKVNVIFYERCMHHYLFCNEAKIKVKIYSWLRLLNRSDPIYYASEF